MIARSVKSSGVRFHTPLPTTSLNIEVNGLCVHSMRATATTNALSHEADIAKVQEWRGHANVSTHPGSMTAARRGQSIRQLSREVLNEPSGKANYAERYFAD